MFTMQKVVATLLKVTYVYEDVYVIFRKETMSDFQKKAANTRKKITRRVDLDIISRENSPKQSTSNFFG